MKALLTSYNLRLYYTGMFYNLFLPGGVGGDVYKVMVLKKRELSILSATKATLLDRVTGLLVLLSLMIISANFIVVPMASYLCQAIFIGYYSGICFLLVHCPVLFQTV